MSYNASRQVSPDVAICSASSASAGYVSFAFVHGSFTPSIATTTISLDAGFEYYIITALALTLDVAGAYFTEINRTAGSSYYLSAVLADSGKDEQWDSVLASAEVTFKASCNQIVSSNSRVIIWRFPL